MESILVWVKIVGGTFQDPAVGVSCHDLIRSIYSSTRFNCRKIYLEHHADLSDRRRSPCTCPLRRESGLQALENAQQLSLEKSFYPCSVSLLRICRNHLALEIDGLLKESKCEGPLPGHGGALL